MRKKTRKMLKRKYRKLEAWEAKTIRKLRDKFPWLSRQTVGEIFDTVAGNVWFIDNRFTWTDLK